MTSTTQTAMTTGDVADNLAYCIVTSTDTKLAYRIHSSSPHSGNFKPSNVLINRPHDQLSRWSVTPESSQQHFGATDEARAAGGSTAAFIMLELEHWAILRSIDIGKFTEPHPCHPQSIRVFAGSDPSHLREVCRSRLRNDGKTECVSVRWAHRAWTGDMTIRRGWEAMRDTANELPPNYLPCPVKHIKIIPGPAYEPRFNSSIWHIALNGVSEAEERGIVTKARKRWIEAESLHANRLVLKHLRANGMQSAFRSVMDELGRREDVARTPPHPLEHPLIERFHEALVERGDFDQAEVLFDEMMQIGLMDERIQVEPPATYAWINVGTVEGAEVPSSRGGHALCATGDAMDGGNSFYLFGGFDGKDALNDLWHGEVIADGDQEVVRWTPILRTDPDALWPGPRLDHQLIAGRGKLWMIGGDEPVSVQPPPPSGEGSNASIGASASESYGLVAPDMMDVVEHARTATRDDIKANVLWSFDLAQREWHRHGVPSIGYGEIEMDQHSLAATVDDRGQAIYVLGKPGADNPWKLLRYRPAYGAWDELSHDCVLDLSKPRVLGFQDDFLIVFNEATGEVIRCNIQLDRIWLGNFVFSSDDQRASASDAKLSRSYIDRKQEEVVSIFGHEGTCILPKQGKVGRISHFLPSQDRWQTISPDPSVHMPDNAQASVKTDKTTSRCGHEVVYTTAGQCYVVGGQTGGSALTIDCRRLDIRRLGSAFVQRQALLAIRTQRFLEMAETATAVDALAYLQEDLHDQVDHTNAQESRAFHALLKHLVGRTTQPLEKPSTIRGRRATFEKIMHVVTDRYKEPEVDLCNLASMF